MSSQILVSLTLPIRGKRTNKKTGPIPVSTSSAKTCPASCPFNKGNGCYAETGPLAIHWRKVTEGKRGVAWSIFLSQIESLPIDQLWRHNQAGDLPNQNERIDSQMLRDLVKANQNKKGFTYTHIPPSKGNNRRLIKFSNENGFTINLSANNPAHADRLKKSGVGPVVTVLPHTVDGSVTPTLLTPKGNKIVVCPATYRENVTCKTCQLCQKVKRSCIVGFPSHGTKKKVASDTSVRSF
jgi:hypothetical protein